MKSLSAIRATDILIKRENDQSAAAEEFREFAREGDEGYIMHVYTRAHTRRPERGTMRPGERRVYVLPRARFLAPESDEKMHTRTRASTVAYSHTHTYTPARARLERSGGATIANAIVIFLPVFFSSFFSFGNGERARVLVV